MKINIKNAFIGIVSLISMSFSANSIACPDFSGVFYKCTTGDRVMDVVMGINRAKLNVTQVNKNITVDFLGKETTLKIDEIVEVENYSQSQRATIYSKVYSSCQNEVLTIEEDSRIVFDSGKVETESSITDVTLKNRKINMKIAQQANGGDTKKLNITCKKR